MSLRQELVRYYHWLRAYGYNDSHSGNASLRDDDTIWITPTGAGGDTLTVDGLVACRLNGIAGERASLDAPLHLAVYRACPQARAILHSHGPYTVALTFGGADFVPIDFEGQYYFPRVPVVTIPYPDYVAQSPARVAAALSEHPIMVVRGHGVYACAQDLDLAYKWTCSLEHSAKTAYLARQAGTAIP
jgi:L-fuculose-phosphate aldolase